MKNKLVLVLIFLLALCLFGVSCNDETSGDNKDNKDNKDNISDNSENKNDDTNKDDNDKDNNIEELDSIIISIYDEINFYLVDKEDSSKRTEITEKVDLENYLNKVSESKAVFYLVKENNELAEQLDSIDLIKAYINYYFNIYVVSSKTSEMSEGDLIIVNGQCAIVGLNAFDTMANVLIYVNALPKSFSPVIYLDSGEYNEVFNLYHDNLTIYGICAGLTLEERSEKEESIFSGSVSVKGNNIKIKGLAVDDLENTFTVTGNDFIKEDIVLNVK